MALSASEHSTARALREEIAPVLANGVVCAMRDQPSDPAAYMAEYLAVAGGVSGSASQTLDQRKFGQECARLDAELASLKDQLSVARSERSRRLPSSADADAQRNAAVASAAWSEVRRLKRLARSMKIKVGEPLSASDWPIPEGCVLIQGGRALGSTQLVAQLQADFGVGHVEVGGEFGGDEGLAAAYDTLQGKPTVAVMLHGYLSAAHCRTQLERCTRTIGKPTAVLLLQAEAADHAQRVIHAAAEAGTEVGAEAADREVRQWGSDVTTIEAAAREARIPVLRVVRCAAYVRTDPQPRMRPRTSWHLSPGAPRRTALNATWCACPLTELVGNVRFPRGRQDVSGDFNKQMTNLLVACTSL